MKEIMEVYIWKIEWLNIKQGNVEEVKIQFLAFTEENIATIEQ